MKSHLWTFQQILNCFIVAALTSLSIWHAYNFYADRFNAKSATKRSLSTEMKLIPLDRKQQANTATHPEATSTTNLNAVSATPSN